ncbi:hypothetical protein ACS0TY_036307 [Phlomoides rotata]
MTSDPSPTPCNFCRRRSLTTTTAVGKKNRGFDKVRDFVSWVLAVRTGKSIEIPCVASQQVLLLKPFATTGEKFGYILDLHLGTF